MSLSIIIPTLNEAANLPALLAEHRPKLVIVSIGGNDFLRTYGTRAEFTDLDAQLAGGEVTIDLLETSLGLSATICAAGLDAQVAYGIPKFRRIPLCGGEAAYALSIVQQLLSPIHL